MAVTDVIERYLIVDCRTEPRRAPYPVWVCTAEEWPFYQREGWVILARDPDPNRPVPWDDAA